MADTALDLQPASHQPAGHRPASKDTFTRLMAMLEGETQERVQIDLLKFMINQVTPAIVRAMASGKPASITAPDAQTARLLRRALAETSVDRPTDRLLTINAPSPASLKTAPPTLSPQPALSTPRAKALT
jgi:hypothetical protein